ncbi:MAG: hypothetical protein KJZ98_16435 [Burkholderiaceae bacterium]|jgi:hypothetical protein|nr:hypothetical protein [Burkholderiaceae bacterium]
MKNVLVGDFFRIQWTSTIVQVLESGGGRVTVVRVDGAHDPFDIGTCYLKQLAPGVHRAMGRTGDGDARRAPVQRSYLAIHLKFTSA